MFWNGLFIFLFCHIIELWTTKEARPKIFIRSPSEQITSGGGGYTTRWTDDVWIKFGIPRDYIFHLGFWWSICFPQLTSFIPFTIQCLPGGFQDDRDLERQWCSRDDTLLVEFAGATCQRRPDSSGWDTQGPSKDWWGAPENQWDVARDLRWSFGRASDTICQGKRGRLVVLPTRQFDKWPCDRPCGGGIASSNWGGRQWGSWRIPGKAHTNSVAWSFRRATATTGVFLDHEGDETVGWRAMFARMAVDANVAQLFLAQMWRHVL